MWQVMQPVSMNVSRPASSFSVSALLSPAREYARRRASSLVDALAPRFAEIRRGTIERRAGGEGQPSAAALGHAFLPSELEHATVVEGLESY